MHYPKGYDQVEILRLSYRAPSLVCLNINGGILNKKPTKKERIRSKVLITFEAKIIHSKNVDVVDLLKKETEFLAEPQSVNGCVTDLKLKSVTIS